MYAKLEKLKFATQLNHFVLKTKVYISSVKTAMDTFQELWENTENHTFA